MVAGCGLPRQARQVGSAQFAALEQHLAWKAPARGRTGHACSDRVNALLCARAAHLGKAAQTNALALHSDRGHDPLRENLLRLGVPVRDPLLAGVAQKLLQCRPVLFDAVREWVAVKE